MNIRTAIDLLSDDKAWQAEKDKWTIGELPPIEEPPVTVEDVKVPIFKMAENCDLPEATMRRLELASEDEEFNILCQYVKMAGHVPPTVAIDHECVKWIWHRTAVTLFPEDFPADHPSRDLSFFYLPALDLAKVRAIKLEPPKGLHER